jgi:hypothetical protein
MYTLEEVYWHTAEELAETIQAIAKMQRFGITTVNPFTNRPNIQVFLAESFQAVVLLDILHRRLGFKMPRVTEDDRIKATRKFKAWQEFAEDRATGRRIQPPPKDEKLYAG